MENTKLEIEKEAEKRAVNPTEVVGWGIDADPENDPTYPMRMRGSKDEHAGYSWERPTQQTNMVEVLHSNERPNFSAVVGTSTPPAGISGMIRRRAFDYSENSYAHWIPLMLADRIGMVEGVITDLAGGRVPNIIEEMGLKAEWKHNRANLVTKIAVGAAAIGILAYLIKRRSDVDESDN